MIAKVAFLFAIVAAAHASVLLNSGLVAAPGLLNSRILAPGIINSGLVAAPGLASPLVYSNGLIGASPLAINHGIVSPIGLRSAGILAGPGIVSPIGLRSAGILAGPGLLKTTILK